MSTAFPISGVSPVNKSIRYQICAVVLIRRRTVHRATGHRFKVSKFLCFSVHFLFENPYYGALGTRVALLAAQVHYLILAPIALDVDPLESHPLSVFYLRMHDTYPLHGFYFFFLIFTSGDAKNLKHISKKRFCTWALTVHPTGCPLISSLEPNPRKLMENLFSVIVNNFEKIIFFRPNYLLLVCLWQKKTFFFQKLVKMTKNYATDFRRMDSKHLVEDP